MPLLQRSIVSRAAALALFLVGFGKLSAAEPTTVEGLRHSWAWTKSGLAAEITCQASPSGKCHFRLSINMLPRSTQRVPVGKSILFNFGSSAATYCAAAEERKEAPCEPRFITAGFHTGGR